MDFWGVFYNKSAGVQIFKLLAALGGLLCNGALAANRAYRLFAGEYFICHLRRGRLAAFDIQ